MSPPRNGDRRPDAPAAAAHPAAVEAALCGLLQALRVDHRAVRLTPEEADALLTRLRQGRDERVPRTFLV
jgi:hypothetical protein